MKREIRGKLALTMAALLLAGALGGCRNQGETQRQSIRAQTDAGQEGQIDAGQEGQTEAAAAAQAAGVGIGALEGTETQDSNVATGRYMEEKLAVPEEIFCFLDGRVLADGTIEVIGSEPADVGIYCSGDHGTTWEKTLSLNEALGLENSYAMCAAIAPDGGVFCDLYLPDGNDYSSRYVKISADGSWADVTLAQEFTMASSMKYYENGKVLAHFVGDSIVYLLDDTSGQILRTYNEDGGYINFFGLAQDQIIAVGDEECMIFDYESAQPSAMDTLTQVLKEDKKNYEIGVSQAYPIIFCGGSQEGELYFGNRSGICRYVKDGVVVEQIVDGNLNSLSKPSVCLEAMQVLADGSFLIFAREETAEIYRYTYDESAPVTPGRELKIYALEEDTALQQIAADFQTKNPDYYVNLEIGITGEDAVTASDALRTLNTQMVAGNGPDILILDGLPVDSYIERGMLADLREVEQEVEAADGLWKNIADTFAQGDALYAMPSRFKVPVLVGDPQTIAGITSLPSLTESAQSMREADPQTTEIMDFKGSIYWGLKVLYQACTPALITQDGLLDQEKLQEFIAQAHALFALNQYDQQPEEIQEAIWQTTRSSEDYGYDFSTTLPVFSIAFGSAKMGTCNLANCINLQTIAALVNQLEVNVDYTPLHLCEGNVFLPASVVGISSQSSQMEGARAFVSYLLSQDAQAVNSGSGFPVNRAAFEAELSQEATMSSGLTLRKEDGSMEEVEYDCQQLTEEEQAKFCGLVEQLDTAASVDAVMEDLILTQVGECLAGHLSEEDAAQAIEQKMSLYLAE